MTIRFAVFQGYQDAFEELAADFHTQNPAIQVEIVLIEDLVRDAPDTDTAILRLVSAADVVHYTTVPESAAAKGLLRDLTPFIEADDTFAPEDFFPGMLGAFRYNGRIWALPEQAHLCLLFYDKQNLDDAGVPYPTLDWTQDDLRAAAQQLTLRQGDNVVRYGFADYCGLLNAPALGTLEQTSQSANLNMPAIASAVRWYTDLALRDGVMPQRDELFEEVEPGAYSAALPGSGRVAMWTDELYMDISDMSIMYKRSSLGVAPIPTNDQPVVPAWTFEYIMSAGTEHPQEAWAWMRFLTHHQLPNSYGLIYFLPARRSVAEQTGYWTRFDAETLPVIQFAAAHLSVVARTTALFELQNAVTAVFAGKPVEEALSEAQATLEATLAQQAQATPVPVVVATPRPPGSGVTIAFAPPPGVDAAPYSGLAETFRQEHDVEVQIILPNQLPDADCFADSSLIVTEGGQARPMNLQPLVEADASFSLDDLAPAFLQASRYQGDLWSIPLDAQARAIFYNRDIFDAANLPYPTPGWTLDDFLADAVALTSGSGEDKVYGFLPLNGDAVDLRTLMTLHGAQLWDEQGQPRFDSPDVVAALRWYSNLILTYTVAPAFPDDLPQPSAEGWQARSELVSSGRAGMWSDLAGIDRSGVWPDAEVGMAPLPLRAAGEQGVTDVYVTGLFIAAETQQPQACWEWIKFLSAQETAVEGMPARQSVLDSSAFAARLGDDAVATYRALLGYADVSAFPTAQAAGQLQWLSQALADVLNGASLEAALAEAQRQAEE